MSRTRLVTSVLAAALVGFFVHPAGSQPIVHRVVSADSGWHVSGKRLLRGMPISQKDQLSADTAGDLILECGPQNQLRHYSCARGGCKPVTPCSQGSPEDPAVVVKSVGGLLWNLSNLLTREPRQPVLAAARAGGDPNDAVVRLDSPRVHLGPALTRVLEGRYCFLLDDLPASTTTPTMMTLDWDRAIDSQGITTAPGVAPGLYRLQKGTATDGACRADPDGAAAWVLIASAESFARLDSLWKEQAAVAADLERSGASRSTVTTVRHGALAALAETISRR